MDVLHKLGKFWRKFGIKDEINAAVTVYINQARQPINTALNAYLSGAVATQATDEVMNVLLKLKDKVL